jgi:hypothetical protein
LAQSKRADELEMTEREQIVRRFLAVELNDLQAEVFCDIGHFAGRAVNENTDGCYR